MTDGGSQPELVVPDPSGIGVWAAQFGSGQHRFWLVPVERISQQELYDRAAGVLMRELGGNVLLSALWLYPPGDGAATTSRTETFMLHLVARKHGRGHGDEQLESEYDRLARAVIGELADPAEPAWPEL